MKRLSILSTLIVLLLSVAITGAQGNQIVLQVAVTGFAEDGLQEAVDAYEELNPGVQVQLVGYDGFGMPANPNNDSETYHEDLLTYFQTADVVLVDDGLNSEATRAGYVLDLAPLTQSDPDYNESNYHQTMIDAFKWDFGQWALPVSASFTTITYSQSAFDAAGLNYPDASWTLTDLIFAAQTLTQYDADGSVALPGLAVQGGSSLDYLLISAYGQSVADDISFPSVPDYSDVALADMLEQWYAFESEGYTTLPSDVDNDDVPMRIGNPQQGGGGFPGANQDTDTATALLPGGSAGMNVTGYAVSAGTTYPREAFELALYLTGDANAISVSGGTVDAMINAPELDDDTAQPGPGRFNQTVSAAFEPLVDTAVASGISQADLLFAGGLSDALDLMESDSLSASDALETILDEQLERLTAADALYPVSVAVNPPEAELDLSGGQIALEFGILAGGGRGPGGGVSDTWESLAEEFVAQDSQVADITIEQLPPNTSAVPETTQCYYSSSNILADADLSTLLVLDPMLLGDMNYDPDDYVGDVLSQMQVDGMTYGIPLTITPLVMRLDPAAFNQAGVPIPQGTWTVSEFEDALRGLESVVAEGVSPLNITGSAPLINLIAIYGGAPFDFSGDTITVNFTDPATVAAIQQVLDLADDGLIAYAGDGGGFGGAQNTSPIIEQDLIAGNFGGGFGPGGNQQNAERITVTFPQGVNSNAVAYDTGTMYINADAANPDACYRFMSYVAQNADAFDAMPATYSMLNSSRLLDSQGQETVDFYLAMADIIADTDTLVLPTNINQLGFGATQWLTAVFDSYLAGEVVDLETDLAIAQQRTNDYLSCVDGIEFSFDDPDSFTGIQEQIESCVTSAEA